MSNIKDEIKSKDKQIKELQEEDKRLNQIIIDLHKELEDYNIEIRKLKRIITIQRRVIDCYSELGKIATGDRIL